ncbi:bifunctional alpha/beta hydrolase/class I SAM-dependent methyltransferase [Methylocystis heyeri]|uniref:Alpha/beta fold hydrolase n=1 Tax=Methylocystis heyeri TaxID=391905 RepID=A0A6B8KCP3_9HYPH|nr:bifunctional alpha/beta hydrolase/class I SAM-dependent methyltransferase [Methylocystis heyeri]QGM45447.1 alpha/beta fold hydrolase [Methylocystis heyeri]
MTRIGEDDRFTTHDGVELFYRRWAATTERRRGAVVLFHRGHEHGARMAHLVDELDLPDFDFYAWDARGHGLSPGARGHSPSFSHSVRDVETFVSHIEQEHGVARADMAVVAQSVGAVVAATWAHDYAPRIRALVLAAPAFSVKLYVPLARPGLQLLRRLRGNFDVNSYLKSRFLTHDPARRESFDADPLISRAISVDILLGLYEAGERVAADARAITIPTQVLVAGADFVVRSGPQHAFFVGLASGAKERKIYPGLYHDLLGERDRAPVIADIRRFVLDRFAEPLETVDLRWADRVGYTRDEADQLASPLPALSLRGLWWSAYRANLKLGGLLSEGIKLGHATGFDSGSTLDYVYRDTAQGVGVLGRAIDRAYLDATGWRGIRQRKLNVEELIRIALTRLRADGAAARVVDIAAGHGRYVLEALISGVVRPESILLRDYSELNVAAGSKLIAEKGLADIARFERGDAFDGADLAALSSRPTLAIVSGLYELFPDNALVARSLGGLGRAVPPGGFLVYTGQPWHPQLEMIARALTSHRAGQAWVMRRRTQAEMDQLVAAAGFRKIEQRIDPWGIFTVSLAVREAEEA